MSILVLGGTGLIGSRLTRRFLSLGHRVICFELYPDFNRVADLHNVEVVVADVTRFEDIIAAIRNYDVERIVNLAYILPPESEEKLQLAMRVNQMGMNNVFEAARLMGIRRVVYASTIAVYGLQDSFGDRRLRRMTTAIPLQFTWRTSCGMSSWRRSAWSGTVWRFRGCVSPTWPRLGGQRASPPGRAGVSTSWPRADRSRFPRAAFRGCSSSMWMTRRSFSPNSACRRG